MRGAFGRSVACALLMALCGGAGAQTPPEGVFAVLGGLDPATGEPFIKGTGFLVDAELGLILTAMHVLEDCGVIEEGSSVKLRTRWPVNEEEAERLAPWEFTARLLKRGYDPADGNGTGSVRDWALLSVEDQGDRDLLGAHAPFVIPAQTKGRLPETIRSNRRNARVTHIYGFPRGGMNLVPERVEPIDNPLESGLWQATGRVEGGNSGGPCAWLDREKLVLLGIVLRESEANRNHNELLAACDIVSHVARAIPASARTNRIVDLLRAATLQGDAPFTDRQVITASASLSRLTPVEHLQLLDIVCDDTSTIGPRAVCELLSKFLKRFTDYPELFGNLCNCRDDVKATLTAMSQTSAQALQVQLALNDLDQARLVVAAAESLSDSDASSPFLPDGAWTDAFERSVASRLMANAAIINEGLYGTAEESDISMRLVRLAYDLDRDNPALPAVMALAWKSLPDETKFSLTAPDVCGVREDEFGELLIAVEDRFLFNRVWDAQDSERPGTSPCSEMVIKADWAREDFERPHAERVRESRDVMEELLLEESLREASSRELPPE